MYFRYRLSETIEENVHHRIHNKTFNQIYNLVYEWTYDCAHLYITSGTVFATRNNIADST